MTKKEYKSGINTIIRINNEGLHIAYCISCNNQLDHLEYGGYNYCRSKNFDCKKCDKPCTGLKGLYETGCEIRTVHGYCKKCNSYIEYEG
jgi:hypothetical protein